MCMCKIIFINCFRVIMESGEKYVKSFWGGVNGWTFVLMEL